jgi:hypothetical protein
MHIERKSSYFNGVPDTHRDDTRPWLLVSALDRAALELTEHAIEWKVS